MNLISRPFRADIVGSFLRPAIIKEARDKLKKGEITAEKIWEIENVEIAMLVKKLIELGLDDVTDGELRRSWWHFDWFWGLKGVEKRDTAHGLQFAHIELRAETFWITSKVEYNPEHPFFKWFEFLKSVVPSGIVPKVCIPSGTVLLNRFNPALLHPNTDPKAYTENTTLFDDLGVAYQRSIKHFYDQGCRYLQIDDTSWGGPISLAQNAHTPEDWAKVQGLVDNIVLVLNKQLENRPKDLHVSMHICKGNNQSDFLFSGSYDPVSEGIAKINVDTYFLEYDDERSGNFGALAKIAANGKNQNVVLGLITSKFAKLESEDQLIARIEEAVKYIPKERLALSAQCGYASSEEGNRLTEDEQWAKVALTVRVAKKVWGEL